MSKPSGPKAFPSRLPPELYEELTRRAAIEQRSKNSILTDALANYFREVKVSKSDVRAAIARLVAEHGDEAKSFGDE